MKTGKPEFAHQAKPCKMAHLKRLYRLGTLMSELVNEDILLWEKKDNQENGDAQEYVTAKDSYNELFPFAKPCQNGLGRGTLKYCGILGMRFFMIRRNIIFIRTITVSIWEGGRMK